MDILKIKAAAKIATAKTNDRRWINAIDKAVAGVESGWWIITELAHSVAVTTECGNTYFANADTCQCKAFENGQRSEEHTSELQSQSNLVCRLLLEKKKKKKKKLKQNTEK